MKTQQNKGVMAMSRTGHASSWIKKLSAIGGSAVLVGAVAPLVLAGSASAAGTSTSCSVATGGSATHTSQVCWIDFSAADFSGSGAGSGLTPYGTAGGQHYTLSIGNGYTMEFDLQYRSGNGTPSVAPLGFDAGAWLGGASNPSPGYTGTTGDPALLTNNDTTGDELQMNNIRVYDGVGAAVAPYRIVTADAEETGVAGGGSPVPEQIVFRSQTPLTQIENTAVGETCGGTGSGFASGSPNTYICDGSAGTQQKAAVFSATNAGWARTDRQTSNGIEATAFGVIPPTKRPPTGSMTASTTAHPTQGLAVGSVVTFTTKVKNTGGNTLSNVAEVPKSFSGTGTKPVFTCAASSLAGGVSTTCTASYTITAADARAGVLSLVTRTTGQDGNGNTITAVNTGGVNGGVRFGIGSSSMTQTTTARPLTRLHTGSVVTFVTRVRNTGNQPLSHIVVGVVRFTGSGRVPHFRCAATTLTHGHSTVCKATYRLTARDMARGRIRIAPRATGINANGRLVVATAAAGRGFTLLTLLPHNPDTGR